MATCQKIRGEGRVDEWIRLLCPRPQKLWYGSGSWNSGSHSEIAKWATLAHISDWEAPPEEIQLAILQSSYPMMVLKLCIEGHYWIRFIKLAQVALEMAVEVKGWGWQLEGGEEGGKMAVTYSLWARSYLVMFIWEGVSLCSYSWPSTSAFTVFLA